MDYDVDSVIFSMRTVDILFVFTGLLMVHLWSSPHVVSDLSHMVLLGDFGWKIYAFLPDRVKMLVCGNISQMGPIVYLSLNKRSFIRGKCVIPLQVLVDALRSAGVLQVVFNSYGIMSSEMVASLQNLRLPRNPIAPCRWDIGLEFDVEGGGIPLFSLNKGISRGKVFPMLLLMKDLLK